jgi:putative ABC transport system permease protein
MALGLGAATAMLGIVDSVLLRPIALPHAEQLVTLVRANKWGEQGNFTFEQLDTIRKAVPNFAEVLEYTNMPKPVRTTDGIRMSATVETSLNFFRALGVSAHLGRTFADIDKNANVAVISNAFWRENLHSDPRVIGSKLTVYGRIMTIIGVMPAGFYFPPQTFNAPVVAVPFHLDAKAQDYNGFVGAQSMARLRSGSDASRAEQQLRAVFTRNHWGGNNGGRASLRSYRSTITGDEQPALLALLGACVALLLIACANTANLQIVRGTARATEMSLRAALGAGRGRLLQLIATESVTISLLGAGCGLALALAIVEWARKIYGFQYARFNELTLRPAVFVGCAVLAVGTGLLAAVAPSLAGLRNAGQHRPSQGVRTVTRLRLSSTLVVAEIALTCVLLATAGLFLRTFRALEAAPLGFDPKNITSVVLMSETPSLNGQVTKVMMERVLDRLSVTPGIQSAASQTSVPFSSFNLFLNSTFALVGYVIPKGSSVSVSLISDEYARAMNISMLQGRSFLPTDREGSLGVCIVNQTFVRRFLRGQPAPGNVVQFTSDDPKDPDNRFMKAPLTIVGVAPDEVAQGIVADTQPTVFIHSRQFPADNEAGSIVFGTAPQFVVRSTLPQATLEREIRHVLKTEAPGMAEMTIQRVEDAMQKSLSDRRLALRLASMFGFAALVLATVGIYGVLAYSVAQRTREIGIRMALGSSRSKTISLILQQVGVMGVAGLTVGIAGAWPAGRAVRSFLFGVQPVDTPTLLITACLMLLVCTIAAALPAWRAAQVDPMEALRTE